MANLLKKMKMSVVQFADAAVEEMRRDPRTADWVVGRIWSLPKTEAMKVVLYAGDRLDHGEEAYRYFFAAVDRLG